MNEQELADLFSEQLDRMLHGESTTVPPGTGDLQDLLDIVEPSTQTQFQASSAAQATFASQLMSWFGAASGGSLMTILGLSKTWFIAIVTSVVAVVGGTGLIAVVATTVLIFGSGTEPEVTPTVVASETPGTPSAGGQPSLSFQGDELGADALCESTYQAQGTLANHGDGIAANVVLGWEIVKGAELVDAVRVTPATFSEISGHGERGFSVEVDVNDDWWQEPDGTEVKIRLFIENEDNRPGHHQTQAHVTLVKEGDSPSSAGPCPTPTPTFTPTPVMTSTVVPTGTPEIPQASLPTLIFINQLHVTSLCQGAYVTQSTLVNYGSESVTDAGLVWEVIEGAEFVEEINVASDQLAQAAASIETDDAGSSGTDDITTTGDDGEDSTVVPADFVNFSQIAVDQEVDLDIAVDVDDDWWEQPDGTEIKIKLSVENKIEISSDDDDDGDLDRGHGNDADGFDEDNPGHGQDDDFGDHSQIITIVKQGAEWVILDGFLHDHGEQTFLVSGTVVVINDCTGLPPQLPIGSEVKIIGQLLPDGTFLAINIIVIDVDVTIDFDSGVSGGGSDDDDDDGGSGGGGGSRGGSRGGSGGSRGGSGGSGGS